MMLLSGATVAAGAQATTPAAAPSSFCWRSQVPARCRSALIFDEDLFLSPNPKNGSDALAAWNLGVMVSRDSTSAVGGALDVAVSDVTMIAALARYRRWFGTRTALDLGGGIGHVGASGGRGGLQPAASIALEYAGSVGVIGRLQREPTASKPHLKFYYGVHFAGPTGVATSVASLALLVAAVAAYRAD